LPRVLAKPNDLAARGAMQLGACLAGMAIENSMLGAAHALANPLTAAYGIAHGEAIALMLPHVIRRNGRHVEASYRELVEAVRHPGIAANTKNAAESLAGFVTDVAQQAGLAARLNHCRVRRDDLPKLAAAAAQQWTGQFNPIELTTEEYLKLYETAF
jgi:alcohol dehydrogenase